MPSKICSFGFKHGIPEVEPNSKVIDVRHLPNPFMVPALKGLTGRDVAVKHWFSRYISVEQTIRDLVNGFGSFDGPVYIGCTGGKHRSVYVAEVLGFFLDVPIEHLHIGKG